MSIGGPVAFAPQIQGWDMLEDGEMEDTAFCLDDESEEEETNGGTPHAEETIGGREMEFALDLAAYRKRAAEMLLQLRSDNDTAHALGVLAVKLTALVEDLHSIGAEEEVIEPLADLLREIQAGKGSPAKAEEVLLAFAGQDLAS
jgi:hypothetical protein